MQFQCLFRVVKEWSRFVHSHSHVHLQMLSPATFDSVLISKLDESVAMPVDLVVWSSDNHQLFQDRIFTVRKIIQPNDLAPGLYRITMTNEFGLVHEGYYSKI